MEEQVKKHTTLLPLFLTIGASVFPGAIIGYVLYYILFQKQKHKPVIHVLISIVLFIVVLLIQTILSLLNNINIVTIYIIVCLYYMVFEYLFLCLFQARQLKIRPELRYMNGWAKDFNYKKTFFELKEKEKIVNLLQNGKLYDKDKTPIGVLVDKVLIDADDMGNHTYIDDFLPVYRHDTEANYQTFLFGSPGSGKTQAMKQMIKNDIINNKPSILIDFKNDMAWVYLLSKLAKEHDREFYHFVSGKKNQYNNPYCKYQASYDPIAVGGATAKADMILNLRVWDSASDVYKQQTQSILQTIFSLLDNVDRTYYVDFPWNLGSLEQLVKILDPNVFQEMLIAYKKQLNAKGYLDYDENRKIQSYEQFLEEAQTNKGVKEQLNNLKIQLRTLAMSDYGIWLQKGNTPNHINLLDIAQSKNGPVVLFSFNEQEEREFARIMGNLVLNDINRVAATKVKQNNHNEVALYIDETQTLEPIVIRQMLEKVRASNIFVTLSTQSPETLVSAANKNGEETKDAIFENINNFLIFQGAGKDTAEEYSKMLGEVVYKTYTSIESRNTGFMSLNFLNARNAKVSPKYETSWIVSPSKFISLKGFNKETGERPTAYFITKRIHDSNFNNATLPIARKVEVHIDNSIKNPPQKYIERYNTPKKVKKISHIKKDIQESKKVVKKETTFSKIKKK